MIYQCPHGCDSRRILTLRGWKKHMTQMHDSWNDEQLKTVMQQIEGSPEQGFERLGERLGETESSDTETTSAETKADATAASQPIETKRRRVGMKKFRSALQKFPQHAFTSLGITLDDDDKGMLEEAIEFLLDLFGVEIEFVEKPVVLKSRIWALLVPIAAVLIVFGKHQIPEQLKKALENAKQNNRGNRPEAQRQDDRRVSSDKNV